LLAASQSLGGEVLDKVKAIRGTFVHYKLVLPNFYDPAKPYPAVLAFPGGPQNMSVVQGTLERNWRTEAERRGYIMVMPAAPDGSLFFEEGARVFPKVLTQLLADFKKQVSYRRNIQRRSERLSHRLHVSAILLVGNRLPRLSIRTHRGAGPRAA
jgi:hypothetical protein